MLKYVTYDLQGSGLRKTYELVLLSADVGDIHVVGGRAELLELLASEDVDGNQVDLGVTVLASLGGRHVDNLARAVLDNDVPVLAQSRALHGEGRRRAGVGRLELVIVQLERVCQLTRPERRAKGGGQFSESRGQRMPSCGAVPRFRDAGWEFALATNNKWKYRLEIGIEYIPPQTW